MILQADALHIPLVNESVQCVVTSPPYWGLRDYGVAGQLGLETTPETYVERLVDVFREVRRVLREDGTLWLNLGDSYAASRSYQVSDNKNRGVGAQRNLAKAKPPPGLKPKDLVGIPWSVAKALQAPYYTGKIARESDRAWLAALVDGEGTFTILCTTSPHGSGNSYPPIAQVRMTSAGVVAKAASLVGVASPAQYPPSNRGHRAVYQWRLSGGRAAEVARELYPYLIEKRKQALIVWNHQAVRESYETKRGVTIPRDALAKQQACRDLIRRLNHGEDVDVPSWMVEPPSLHEPGWYLRSDVIWHKPNPMPESVTDRPTRSHEYLFLLAKIARYFYDGEAIREAFQESSVERRKYPSAPTGPRKTIHQPKHCDKRGAEPVLYEANGMGRNRRSVWTIATQSFPDSHFATFPEALVKPCILAGCPAGGIVLDPFVGSGTVVKVAQDLGRIGIGMDLKPEYLAMANKRTAQQGLKL